MSQLRDDKWYYKFLNPQTIVYLAGGVVALVIFWIRTKESWDKVKSVSDRVDRISERKAEAIALEALAERVNKQYTTMRDITERIVTAEKWIEYHKGYEQARKDLEIK